RLGRAQRYEVPVVGRQSVLEPANEMAVDDVRADEPCADRDNRHDKTCAELAEMLDERRLFAVGEAPRQALHDVLDGVVLAGGGAARDRDGLNRRRSRQLRLLMLLTLLVVVAGDRALELAHPLAKRAAHLRQPLRPEDEEHDEREDEQLPRRDPTWH